MPLEKEFGHGPQPSFRLEQQQPYRNVGRVQGRGVEGRQGSDAGVSLDFGLLEEPLYCSDLSLHLRSRRCESLSSIVIPDFKLIDFHSF